MSPHPFRGDPRRHQHATAAIHCAQHQHATPQRAATTARVRRRCAAARHTALLAAAIGLTLGASATGASGSGNAAAIDAERETIVAETLDAADTAITTMSTVRITEVLFNVPREGGDANGDGRRQTTGDEFVELQNVGDAPVDLTGWRLDSRLAFNDPRPSRGVHFIFPRFTLDAGETAVVFNGHDWQPPPGVGTSRAAPNAPLAAFDGAWVFTAAIQARNHALSNSADFILLSDAGGRALEAVTWGSSDPPPPADAIVSRVPTRPKGSVQRRTRDGPFSPHIRDHETACSPGTPPPATAEPATSLNNAVGPLERLKSGAPDPGAVFAMQQWSRRGVWRSNPDRRRPDERSRPMSRRTIHAAPLMLALTAGVAMGVTDQADPPPATTTTETTSEEDLLAGPKVVESGDRAREAEGMEMTGGSIYSHNFDGTMIHPEGAPEEAALALMDLDEATTETIEKVIAEWNAGFDRFLLDNTADAQVYQDAFRGMRSGNLDREARQTIRKALERLKPLMDPPLRDRIAEVLPDDARVMFDALLDDYDVARVADARQRAEDNGRRFFERSFNRSDSIRRLGRELVAAYDRTLKQSGRDFEALLADLALSPESERRVRNLVTDAVQANEGRPDADQRVTIFREVYNILTPEEQARFIATMRERGVGPEQTDRSSRKSNRKGKRQPKDAGTPDGGA